VAGRPRQVLDAARAKRITLHTSSTLLDELAEVLSRPHLAAVIAANQASPAFLMQRYAMLAQLVIPRRPRAWWQKISTLRATEITTPGAAAGRQGEALFFLLQPLTEGVRPLL
jgi:hypothetical protein